MFILNQALNGMLGKILQQWLHENKWFIAFASKALELKKASYQHLEAVRKP
ncbi:hypothetical protein ACRCJU_08495 [Aerococcus urinaeequi]|uniref:hypothetical protein n=1 Tax=Aerococcus urinaeequi TaxID=51665 RepID=UPI003D6A0866